MTEQLKRLIRDIPDFPKPGINFKDLTPMLRDPAGFGKAVDKLAARYLGKKIDVVVGVEARGFVIGAALAYRLGAGVILIRKPGKLPYKTHRTIYELEYGTDTLEIHQDSISAGQRVVIADDLLATGGTVNAAIRLVEQQGGSIVECAFLVELLFLNGREKVGHSVFSLIQF
jgi:adenine phosphoribosyltransferase